MAIENDLGLIKVGLTRRGVVVRREQITLEWKCPVSVIYARYVEHAEYFEGLVLGELSALGCNEHGEYFNAKPADAIHAIESILLHQKNPHHWAANIGRQIFEFSTPVPHNHAQRGQYATR